MTRRVPALLLTLTVLALASAPVRASTIDVRPAAPSDTLTGTVTDSAGTAIVGARVAVVELGRATSTGADGRFRLVDLPAGRHTIVVRKNGYAAVTRVLNGPSSTLDLKMSAEGVSLAAVNVTATRDATRVLDSPLPSAELSGDELRRDQSVSIAHAVSRLPGVRAVTTGGQIGKPMIRGLYGARVLTLDNGSRLEDYSWSDEDGPTIDARLAQRIEVIRGPASVLYGSDAIGGVVNALPADLPDARGRGAYTAGALEVSGATNNGELGTAARLEGARGNIGWRGLVVGRFAEDLNAPGGKLENTGYGAFDGEGAIGWHHATGNTQLRIVHHGGEFKLLEANGPPPGTSEEEEGGPERVLLDDRLQLTQNSFVGSWRLETKAQYQRHNISEKSDDLTQPGGPLIETEVFNLLLNTGTLDVLAHHAEGEHLRGTLGVSGMYQKNDSRGVLSVVPNASIVNGAAFAFEQLSIGKWQLLAGARGDSRHLSADANTQLSLQSQSRTWGAFAGDIGTVFQPVPELAFAANVGRAWRAPTLFELFANGPRLGEARYEIGRADLATERGTNVDASIRWASRFAKAEVAAFRNKIDGFVYITPTGQQQSNLPVYRYVQSTATLRGGEIAAEIRPVEALILRAKHDFVRGTNDDTDTPLPLIAPPRSSVELELEGDKAIGLRDTHAGFEVEHMMKQTRLSTFDQQTGAYTLLNFDAGGERHLLRRDVRFDVVVRNLGDTKYRSYLSRYKSFADDPGRNIILRVSTGF